MNTSSEFSFLLRLLYDSAGSPTFQLSFWAELLAGLLIAGLVSVLLPRLLELRKRPRLVFVIQQGERLKRGQPTKVSLGITNMNRHHTVHEYYWHLLFPQVLAVTIFPKASFGFDVEQEGTWRHVQGFVNAPIFPNRTVGLPFDFLLQASETGRASAAYFFATEHGLSPASAEKYVRGKRAPGHGFGSITFDIEP